MREDMKVKIVSGWDNGVGRRNIKAFNLKL